MWMKENIPNSAIKLTGLTLHSADRVASTSGKLREGGLAVYTDNLWCSDVIQSPSTVPLMCSF